MAYSAFPIPYGGTGGAGGDGKRIKNTWTVSAGHSFVRGSVVRYSGAGIALAQGDSITNVQSIGVVESTTATTVTVIYQGEVEFGSDALTSIVGGASSLVAGTVYYIAQSSAGMLDPNRPESGYVQGILVATGAKTGIVINSLQQSQSSASGVSVNTVGMIVPWAGAASTIPENWKLCDGEAVLKSGANPLDGNEYSDLYDVIGDKYHVSGLIDAITGSSNEDLVVSFLQGHAEQTPPVCHGLCNAWDNSENLDFKIGWGGTNDFAVASIVLADGTEGKVHFRFRESYPGTTPVSDWSLLSDGLPITIQSLEDDEATGYTSDRFFIPDMRARAAFGVGYSTGLSEMVRGEMGGKDVHLLTTNEIPDHNNAVFATDSPTQSGNEVQAINAGITSTTTYETLDASFTADNTPLSLMPPYLATNWIIRFSGADAAIEGATGPTGLPGAAGETGATGETGPAGSTGFGYTAAHVSGDGDLYMSVLFPDGSSGAAFSIGTVVGAAASVGGENQQVLFKSGAEVTGSSNFVFNGTSATFGGAGTQFTVTGPTFSFGNNTTVRGGIFYDAAESAPYSDAGLSPIILRGIDGPIQRFRTSPSSSYTVSVDETSGSWRNISGVAETVVVVLQSTNGHTGMFDSTNILTTFPAPVLGGVTGGIDVFTVMRISYGGGAIKMAFPIARGMTGTNFSIGT